MFASFYCLHDTQGTYQIAMVAKALKRPMYVAVESYKFVRLFPLQQTGPLGVFISPRQLSNGSFVAS